jgi:ATP-dependent RNA helicase RhlE
VGKRLPRVVLPDFDYSRRGSEKLEVPLAERIAAIRARKAEDRARAKAKAERRGQVLAAQGQRPGAPPPSHARPGQHGRPWQGQRPMQRRPGGR